MDAESELLAELRDDLHEAGERNGMLVLKVREQERVIQTMNEAHKLLLAEKDAENIRLKQQNDYLKRQLAIADKTLATIRWNLDMGEKIAKAQAEGRLSP